MITGQAEIIYFLYFGLGGLNSSENRKDNKAYEVCPKSNETGVIKTLLKNIETYQNQIPSM